MPVFSLNHFSGKSSVPTDYTYISWQHTLICCLDTGVWKHRSTIIPDSVTRETRATLEFSFGNHDHKQERSLLKVLEEGNYVRRALIVFLH